MKYVKKLAAVLLAAVMAVSLLTACGGGGGGSTSSPKTFADVFGFTGQELTNSINEKTGKTAEYDQKLGPQFADTLNAAMAAAKDATTPEAAGEIIENFLRGAGLSNCDGGTVIAKQGTEVDIVAGGVVESLNKNHVDINNKKIGYAAAELANAKGYYLIFAVVQDK